MREQLAASYQAGAAAHPLSCQAACASMERRIEKTLKMSEGQLKDLIGAVKESNKNHEITIQKLELLLRKPLKKSKWKKKAI